MGAKMILTKHLGVVLIQKLVHKMLNSVLRSKRSHVFLQVSIVLLVFNVYFFLVRDKHPWQDRVLCDITVAPAGDIIQPL